MQYLKRCSVVYWIRSTALFVGTDVLLFADRERQTRWNYEVCNTQTSVGWPLCCVVYLRLIGTTSWSSTTLNLYWHSSVKDSNRRGEERNEDNPQQPCDTEKLLQRQKTLYFHKRKRRKRCSGRWTERWMMKFREARDVATSWDGMPSLGGTLQSDVRWEMVTAWNS